MTGTQITDMIVSPTVPVGGYVPFAVTTTVDTFTNDNNYIYDLGSALIPNVAATPEALLALTTPFLTGSYLRTADGHYYLVVASGGDLTTAGAVQLQILPDQNGEYQFEAAAPDSNLANALTWLASLNGQTVNVSGDYVPATKTTLTHTITVNGGGSFSNPSAAAFILFELQGSNSEWNVALDGNRSGVTGTANTLYINGATAVRVGATVTNSSASNIYFNNSPHGVITGTCNATGAATSGVIASNGSSYFVVEDGARITGNDLDNLQITDGGTAVPSNYCYVGAADLSNAGTAQTTGYWSGARVRYSRGTRFVGTFARGCTLGAGVIIQAAASSPSTHYSEACILDSCVFEFNHDGAVFDDYSRYCTSANGQYNHNVNDGIDINDTKECKSLGDTTNFNGENGVLFWGSYKARVSKLTAMNNNYTSAPAYDGATAYVVGDQVSSTATVSGFTVPITYTCTTNTTGNAPPVYPTASNTWWNQTSDPNSAAVHVKTNTTTGTVPLDCKVTRSTMGDDQATKSQLWAVRLANGSGHVVEDNDVRDNISTINDVSGNLATNPKRRNQGYKTESNFSATITAGATTVVIGSGTTGIVGTGLSALQQAGAMPLGNLAGNSFWLSTFTTTGFTINIGAALGSDLVFQCWAHAYGDGTQM